MMVHTDGAAQAARASRQTLRPYQEKAISAVREAYRAGKRRILLVCPTGGGKTRMAVEVANGGLAKGQHVLCLAHRDELIDQMADRLRAEGVPRVGIIAAGRPVMNSPVQVASLATLAARRERGLPSAEIVFFDEAHHGKAESYEAVVKGVRTRAGGDPFVLGATATPERGDGQPLGDVFDALVSVSSVRELQRLGVLVPCVTHAPNVFQKALSMDPVAAYMSRTPGERAFVFTRDVKQAENLVLAFQAQGIEAASIHAGTPTMLRKGRLEAFRRQDRQPLLEAGSVTERPPLVLCNAYVLTEGVDVPEASHAILARGCGHPGMMLQMVGRVLRAATGKERAVFSDLCGVTRKRGMGVPEADRVWSLDGTAITLAKHETERPLLTCPACEGTVSTWTTDREGWRICPLCRERISAPEPVKVEPRRQHVFGATASPERKASVLQALARKAAGKGYKPGYVSAVFNETFGHWPSRREAAEAYAQAIDDQGHAPPVREPKAAPESVEEAAAPRALDDTDCPWCERPFAECWCDRG